MRPLRARFPWVTAMLLVSCLLSTIPQFFLPPAYSEISGQLPSIDAFYLVTLNAFTHDPNFLLLHLTWMIALFAVFGATAELVLGHGRYALISLLTLSVTTVVTYLHSGAGPVGHGPSGIAWGYQVFFWLMLIVLYEQRGNAVFRNPLVLLAIALTLLNWIGFPAFQTLAMGSSFYGGFNSDTLHLLSLVVAVPFVLTWRRDIEENTSRILLSETIERDDSLKSLPVLFLLAVLFLNALGTGILILGVLS